MEDNHFFIEQKSFLLVEKYFISCLSQDFCNNYFIKDKITNEVISRELVLTLDKFSKEIHVSRFYPELKLQPKCKYFSAACFYLLVQHFAMDKKLDDKYHVSLDCTPEVFSSFYTKLLDFHFTDTHKSPGRSICAVSDFEISDFKCISMIKEEMPEDFDFYYT
jgi:hypothetical protein